MRRVKIYANDYGTLYAKVPGRRYVAISNWSLTEENKSPMFLTMGELRGRKVRINSRKRK